MYRASTNTALENTMTPISENESNTDVTLFQQYFSRPNTPTFNIKAARTKDSDVFASACTSISQKLKGNVGIFTHMRMVMSTSI